MPASRPVKLAEQLLEVILQAILSVQPCAHKARLVCLSTSP
jgi:hypothetical protein